MIGRITIAIAFVLIDAPAFGQADTSTSESVYKVTRVGGQIFYAASYTEQKPWYIFTSTSGKQSRNLVESVESIVKLDAAMAKRAVDEANDAESRTQARTVARTRARVAARTAPPAPPPVQSYDGGSGYGSGDHIGPRGGVYHYSASGNKVYSKR